LDDYWKCAFLDYMFNNDFVNAFRYFP